MSYSDNCSNSRANTVHSYDWNTRVKVAFIRSNQSYLYVVLVTLDNLRLIAWPCAGDISFKCPPYQLSMVSDMLTMVVTGSGESGFDSGEGA